MKRFGGAWIRAVFVVLLIGAAALGAGVAALLAHAGTQSTRITVIEREFKLTPSRRTVNPGRLTFVVVNHGKLRHSFAISGPRVSTALKGTIAPGGRRTLVVRLFTGTYTLRCPIAGHAARGMKTTIRVHGSVMTSTTSTTSTTTGGWG